VQIANVSVFLYSDADIIVFMITAANISHVNEVECIMPVANLALQHQAFMSGSMSADIKE